jgi:hypothetical protein
MLDRYYIPTNNISQEKAVEADRYYCTGFYADAIK